MNCSHNLFTRCDYVVPIAEDTNEVFGTIRWVGDSARFCKNFCSQQKFYLTRTGKFISTN